MSRSKSRSRARFRDRNSTTNRDRTEHRSCRRSTSSRKSSHWLSSTRPVRDNTSRLAMDLGTPVTNRCLSPAGALALAQTCRAFPKTCPGEAALHATSSPVPPGASRQGPSCAASAHCVKLPLLEPPLTPLTTQVLSTAEEDMLSSSITVAVDRTYRHVRDVATAFGDKYYLPTRKSNQHEYNRLHYVEKLSRRQLLKQADVQLLANTPHILGPADV